MFRVLLSLSPTVYAFLSGLLISVASSAAAMIVFADAKTVISPAVGWSGLVAFMAGLLWFIESELVAATSRHVDQMAILHSSRDAAIAGVRASRKVAIVVIALFAILCSCGWPTAKLLTPEPGGPAAKTTTDPAAGKAAAGSPACGVVAALHSPPPVAKPAPVPPCRLVRHRASRDSVELVTSPSSTQ